MHKPRIAAALFLGLASVGPVSVLAQSAPPAQPQLTQPQPAQPQQGQPKPPARPVRPPPPARQPTIPAKELPDGQVPPVDVDGNFIVGPTHKKAPEMTPQEGVPKGTVVSFKMKSADSKFYPGIMREPGTFGTPDPKNPAKLDVPTSKAAPWERTVTVYVPQQLAKDAPAPFIVTADGDKSIFPALDNLIHQKRVPAQVAIAIANGGGDAQGSQRGLEYDTMSSKYAEWVEAEVLPLVEKEAGVKLTKDPNARATMGCSSGGSCAFIMAWYRPDLYRRVLTTSGTYVNQQWPWNPETPGGAWDLHRTLIPKSEKKPLRIWMQVGDMDLLNPNIMRDNMHDWVEANNLMAQALAAKGYSYQYVFTRNARHCDGAMKQQLLPQALEYIWKDYKPAAK
jgi:enterochelin esterase-like enzyme